MFGIFDIEQLLGKMFQRLQKFVLSARGRRLCMSCQMYTRKNAQVVAGLQTNCYKSVHKLSTSCVRTACSQLL
jgi:hypothetical protein